MNINIKNYVPFMQEGGTIEEQPVEQAPVEQAPAEGDQTQLLLAACQQAVDTQDCNIALQVCQIILQSLGGGAPAEPQGEPVYRRGGKLVRFVKK